MNTANKKALCALYLICSVSIFFQYVVAGVDKEETNVMDKKLQDRHTAETRSASHHATPAKPVSAPGTRIDARAVVAGNDTKEKTPKREVLLRADLTKGQITLPAEGANAGLSEQQQDRFRCRDSSNILHPLSSTYLLYGTECYYYECEYSTKVDDVAWVLSTDIYKCCYEGKYGYKEGAVMQGNCTKKVCMRDGEDNPYEGSVGWQVMETGCKHCTVGLVMLDTNETFYTGDPCLAFQCTTNHTLTPVVVNETCCKLGDRYIADGQLAMTNAKNGCEVSTCKAGKFTNQTKYQPLITQDDYTPGCPVHWSWNMDGCFYSFTKPKRLVEAVHHCSTLAPAHNSRLMRVEFMMWTMATMMELGRWYWVALGTQPTTPRYMSYNNETTPEQYLVGHHAQPVVKRVNRQDDLVFQRAASERNAYVCQMDPLPACKPTNYKEPHLHGTPGPQVMPVLPLDDAKDDTATTETVLKQ